MDPFKLTSATMLKPIEPWLSSSRARRSSPCATSTARSVCPRSSCSTPHARWGRRRAQLRTDGRPDLGRRAGATAKRSGRRRSTRSCSGGGGEDGGGRRGRRDGSPRLSPAATARRKGPKGEATGRPRALTTRSSRPRTRSPPNAELLEPITSRRPSRAATAADRTPAARRGATATRHAARRGAAPRPSVRAPSALVTSRAVRPARRATATIHSRRRRRSTGGWSR